MELSDYLCAFNTSLPFQLVNVYLRGCPLFLAPFPVGHLTIAARIVYSHTSAMCLLHKEHKGPPRFRHVPFDTVPLPKTPEERSRPHL